MRGRRILSKILIALTLNFGIVIPAIYALGLGQIGVPILVLIICIVDFVAFGIFDIFMSRRSRQHVRRPRRQEKLMVIRAGTRKKRAEPQPHADRWSDYR